MNLSKWKWLIGPLASRGVRTALATVLAAYAAEVKLGVSQDTIFTILGVGVALILKIGLEDLGYKSANGK